MSDPDKIDTTTTQVLFFFHYKITKFDQMIYGSTVINKNYWFTCTYSLVLKCMVLIDREESLQRNMKHTAYKIVTILGLHFILPNNLDFGNSVF